MVPIPLNDDIRRRIFWWLTAALILANVWVFVYELSLGRELNRLIYLYGVVPARYTNPSGAGIASVRNFFVSVGTSMFMHGGWLHLLGNMLFLFVFGRSVEDHYGHGKFLLIYLLSGFGGMLLHILLNSNSQVPAIGASAAIAGILGAYFVSFPRARITVLIPLFFFFWTIKLPAVVVLGYWFLIQFFTGFQAMAIQSATSGGVAWWAHVGGFITGTLLAGLFKPRRRVSVELVQ